MAVYFGEHAKLPMDQVGGVAGSIKNVGGSESGALTIHGTPVLTGNVGVPYTPYTLTATGGIAPYSFFTSTLPAGLALNPATGVVSGTPTAAGVTAGIINRVIDAINGHSDLAPFTITISP